MTVREATPADVDEVVALMRRVPGLPQWTSQALAVNDGGMRTGRRLLVAEEAGSLLGFAQTALLLDEAELESIAVAPERQGRGAGRLLLRHALWQARTDGAMLFRLEVRRSNEAALRLYRSAGMVECGVRRGYYRDPFEDAVLLQVSWADAA